jgi:hypothetical protein
MQVATQPVTIASTAPVWVKCPVSAWIAQLYKQPKSLQALEGEAAHEMAQFVLSGEVESPNELVDRAATNGVIFSREMVEPVTIYINEVRRGGPGFWVEESISIETPHEPVTGRCDGANFYLDKELGFLRVIDFKYGYSTIEVDENWSMLAYSIDIATRLTEEGHEVNDVELVIVQPRAYHHDGAIRSWSCSGAQLMRYHGLLMAAVEAVYSEDRECVTGNHCNKCNARANCPVAKMAGMNGIDIAHAPLPDTDTPDQVAALLDTLDRALDVIKHTRSAMEERAVNMISNGQVIPGRSMKPGKSHRKFTNEKETREYAKIMGISVDKNKELCTPAEAVRRGLVVTGITHSPSTAPKLVKYSAATQANKVLK